VDTLRRNTFEYFVKHANPRNGLIADKSSPGSHSSIAATGLGLAAYAVAVDRGYVPRAEGITRTVNTLRFFWESPQGTGPLATGYKGFFYHFLDMETGRRAWECELSTIDTTILLAGALTSAAYFAGDTVGEHEIRDLADALYRRADWQWALNGGLAVTHGWRPESAFLKARWVGYNEALLLYALALGSPTRPIPAESYPEWTRTYRWKRLYGIDYLYAGPLFIHQMAHIWIDFRGIRDAYMQVRGIDYFENSRRATYVQQLYAIRNPRGFRGYHENCWGITASSGPGPTARVVDGVRRRFYGYRARGVPFGPDDGTLAPWAVVASLPFAPEIVLPAIQYFDKTYPQLTSEFGLKCSFNPTFPTEDGNGYISDGYYGLDQGPVVLMIENHETGLIWRLMRGCPYIVTGLRRAGFTGGWLDSA